jgi:hypothetical protein
MTGPGLSREQYKKMPFWAKAIYWVALILILSPLIYYWLV